MNLDDSATLCPTILDRIREGVFVVDRDMRIVTFNRAAEEITGFSAAEAKGQFCYEVFRSPHCPVRCALKETIETGKEVIEREIMIFNRDNAETPVSVNTTPLFDDEGNLLGGIETFRDQSTLYALRRELKEHVTLYDIVTRNNAILETLALLPDMAVSDLPVLIEGESGTGKELVARAIHTLSQRKEKPMITVNCAAIPDNLLESELFGYEKGAFTGAVRSKPGKILLAAGGTLFLDEIGDLPLSFQAKLLRVLEDGVVDVVGGTKTVSVDFRLITATNRTLRDEVRRGTFREDLYYRIGVIRITLPPLRERREDIPLLLDYFSDLLNARLGKTIEGFSRDAEHALMQFDYPGNVRQLKHILEHAWVLCRGKIVHLHHLPEEIQNARGSFKSTLSLTEMERNNIRKALEEAGGNLTRAAKALGIHRTTLWRKVKRYGITP